MIWSKEILIGILIVLLVASAVGGFNYYKGYRYKKLDEVAYKVYLFEAGKLEEDEVINIVKGTPYEVYLLALKGEDVADRVEDEDVRKIYLEARAYRLFKEGRPEEALKLIERIGREDFNYPSAQLLKGIILEKLGRIKEARSVYVKVSAEFRNTYFGRVAYARLLAIEGL